MMILCRYMMILYSSEGTLSLYDDTFFYMMILCHHVMILCHYMMIRALSMLFKKKTRMAVIRINDILHEYGLSHLADNFEREKITQDILCLLSTQDMKIYVLQIL